MICGLCGGPLTTDGDCPVENEPHDSFRNCLCDDYRTCLCWCHKHGNYRSGPAHEPESAAGELKATPIHDQEPWPRLKLVR